ncbi:MAG TPA: Uma2 family endonuclease [Armatimonadaceae bacterium]|nr:Uma2 family endonuclease [Armatimonadaceae bacterium]
MAAPTITDPKLRTGELLLKPTPDGRKRWTRSEVTWMENAGLLTGHYELLNGEIISKTGQNRPHARAVMKLIAFLLALFGDERVQTQATMEVREDDRPLNRPEPDVLVLREGTDRTPIGHEVLLAVEVSDTTQRDDFGPKVGLYARAGVEEYWVLDLTRRVLVAFRRAEDGEWRERAEFAEGDSAAPLCAPGSLIRVADLLPEQGEGPSA